MQLAELLPLVKDLPHTDKLLLLHFIVSELLQESGIVPLEEQGKVSSTNSYNSFEAAAVLAKALSEEKAVKHG
ncbi:MAG: hypothetical protein JGK24_15285 [Microcoleus sp. PH2017_29_MFU_D_A]|jgi:hypothetical protein|uniref:hypothetical protein n=1 Tax=unclassified Microcoleus TaxID=2642155 RepID=UPI001D8E496F|nr:MULTISPECIES: hypothetical protein [unclassified Microcoleus]MCC3465661.1 hypothetical protein [Microcoleus sp. PH2017_06_SFM_O_A]MCC3504717.1 hypothetical protein [Microcoleus sp. PH2017_19_SFW_U_A]TAE15248.1 MAG: hypothetical protein EAZ94_05115 [Oscillatoriales cyanobacterium]MCC3407914.1 hypothetical protein [Microcoleus sp. PH2017_10_PVI_O_A]MCC3410727.1 hypothetical protein [Microcoleus sp. PH2017_02_FOX_O_A]